MIFSFSKSKSAKLIDAAQDYDLEAFRQIIKKKVNINVQDKFGNTPLMIIAAKDDSELTSKLINMGADINCQNVNGYTACTCAVTKGHVEVVKLLIEKSHKLSLNKILTTDLTMLMIAAFMGRTKITNLLIEYGVDVNISNAYGRTALTYAVVTNQIETIENLIKHGADVNVKDLYGNYLLDYANHYNYGELANVIVKNGGRQSNDIREPILLKPFNAWSPACITCGETWPRWSEIKRELNVTGSIEMDPESALESGYGLTCSGCHVSFCSSHIITPTCPSCSYAMTFV